MPNLETQLEQVRTENERLKGIDAPDYILSVISLKERLLIAQINECNKQERLITQIFGGGK